MEKLFNKAKPIWIKDRENEMNLRVQFKAVIYCNENVIVNVATSGIYQLWINGDFVSYGPARAGKGTYRMDEILVDKFLKKEKNTVVIEVDGYNADSYYIQNQPSFLQAEIIAENNILAFTGEDFTARINPYYYQKIQRYGWQRPMNESYYYNNTDDDFLVSEDKGDLEVCITYPKNIIKRYVPYPMYERITAKETFCGEVEINKPEKYKMPRGYDDEGRATHRGFEISELKYLLTNDYQEMNFTVTDESFNEIAENKFKIFSLPYNATGFLKAEITCEEDTAIYITYDEILTDKNKIDALRNNCCCVIRYDLCPGTHNIQFFECYTMKYFQFTVVKGKCRIENLEFIEFKHPPVYFEIEGDEDIQKIIRAGIETFRQCAVDVLMDCPSRERAGWLCDSYFTGKVEYILTGDNIIEKNFLENFLHTENYDNLPDGMFPMCYPADHPNSNFIPNWAMWLVIELSEYYSRTGDSDLINRFKPRLIKLLNYFKGFENEIGLLENLEKWVFLEWSRANDEDLIRGINYPSNMLYYMMLKAIYELYGDIEYLEKANNIKAQINSLAFNGEFYVDHADRINGKIVNKKESTEVCQYYAFFTGIADKNSHSELFEKLMRDFGPNRDNRKVYPEIYPAQPFIGNYLRLNIMVNNGYLKKVEDNIRDYFLYMAEETGTLWEHARYTASCNHGFASYVIYLLSECRGEKRK